MIVPILMPQLGLTMMEGSVSEWLKKPGEPVQKGEMLFLVSTDKADMEVESPAEGTLSRIVVDSGQTVPVGTVIAYLEKPGKEAEAGAASSVAATATKLTQPSPEAAAMPVPEPSQIHDIAESKRERPAASPRARRLALELGIDLSTVKGTGAGGRIVEEDIHARAEETRLQAAAPDMRRRKLIAERMTTSIQTIPHFSVSVEVNSERLLSLYESLKEPVEKATGLKLTLTDLLLKGLGAALLETPEINAAWEEGKIVPRNLVDLGLAIDTGRGVVAPVVRNVDKLDLAAIATRRQELVVKARQGRLSLRDLEGGAGTLSNLGVYRVDEFHGIISPGQSFILAVGRIRPRPWVEDTTLTVRPTVIINLSVDHRLADGAMAALFLGKVAEIIESPFRLLRRSSEAGPNRDEETEIQK